MKSDRFGLLVASWYAADTGARRLTSENPDQSAAALLAPNPAAGLPAKCRYLPKYSAWQFVGLGPRSTHCAS